MTQLLALYGSPRRNGNTATLLSRAVEGAREAGAEVETIVLRDRKISPCLEIYECRRSGRCAIKDDFVQLEPKLAAADGILLASPIFYYAVSAHTKILMDRCNLFWVRKYWIDKKPLPGPVLSGKKALFVGVGATKGRRLFDGAVLSVRYFLDALDMELWRSLLYRGLDGADAAFGRPDLLEEARRSGAELVEALKACGR